MIKHFAFKRHTTNSEIARLAREDFVVKPTKYNIQNVMNGTTNIRRRWLAELLRASKRVDWVWNSIYSKRPENRVIHRNLIPFIGNDAYILITVIIISGVITHAPGKIRYYYFLKNI